MTTNAAQTRNMKIDDRMMSQWIGVESKSDDSPSMERSLA